MEKVQANMIIEILGKPKEHVKEALNTIVQKLSSEKGVKILEKNSHEPVEVKDAKDLYTTFVELMVEFDSVSTYLLISFAYLPSNVEIISPESLNITNQDLTFLGNKIIQRVHEYDAIVKNVLMERDMLVRKLQEVAPHLFNQNQQVQLAPQVTEKKSKPKKKSKKDKK